MRTSHALLALPKISAAYYYHQLTNQRIMQAANQNRQIG